MLLILVFIRNWKKWYAALRYANGFGLLDSMRYGLWLARGQSQENRLLHGAAMQAKANTVAEEHRQAA